MQEKDYFNGPDEALFVREKNAPYAAGDEFSFEIIEHIGVISTSNSGWTKELNIISFCGRPQKYDVREWSKGHDKMSKGSGFTEEEARMLCRLLVQRGLADGEKDAAAADAAPF